MDNHTDMTELERRLSTWQPNSAGLDADAVLFAAGRASVRPGPARFAWPVLSAALTAVGIVLGLWLAAERSERLDLARRLQERPPTPAVKESPPPATNLVPEEAPTSEEPPPDSYLASRPALEKGLDAWPSRVVLRSGQSESSLTNPPILTLGQRDALLDP
jgi:hypothetical protein